MAGTSVYPGAIDNWATDPSGNTPMNTPGVEHHTLHTNHQDALENIENELGINPSGTFATVAARVTDAESKIDDSAADAAAALQQSSIALQTASSKAAAVHTHSTADISGAPFSVSLIPNTTYAMLPAGTTITWDKTKLPGGNWATRPTNRPDLTFIWVGDTDPALGAYGVLNGDFYRQV